MELLSERGGNVRIRFGGTTQDFTTMVPSVPDGDDTDTEKDVMQLQPESSVRFDSFVIVIKAAPCIELWK